MVSAASHTFPAGHSPRNAISGLSCMPTAGPAEHSPPPPLPCRKSPNQKTPDADRPSPRPGACMAHEPAVEPVGEDPEVGDHAQPAVPLPFAGDQFHRQTTPLR